MADRILGALCAAGWRHGLEPRATVAEISYAEPVGPRAFPRCWRRCWGCRGLAGAALSHGTG